MNIEAGLNYARLLEPYSSTIGEKEQWALDTLTSESPDPSEAEAALDFLLNIIEDRCDLVFQTQIEQSTKASIKNAATDLAAPIQHLPTIKRAIAAERLISRWFKGVGELPEDDGPEVPITERTLQRRSDREID